MQIPEIDFRRDRPRAQIVEEVALALGHTGFMTVRNLGIEEAQIEAMFARSREFFHRDSAFKQRYLYRDAAENFGFQALGMESLDPQQPPDLKETFTMRLNPATPLEDSRFPSRDFRRQVEGFYEACLQASGELLAVMAAVFGLPDNFFSGTVGGENVALRLLFYPGGQRPPGDGSLGAGAHTDYGILTLLFQGDVGGLEVRGADGKWLSVPCTPGSVVINTGDLMQHWTNGRFRSTEHRVRAMTGMEDRLSIAFFVDPDSATLVDVLPQCVDEHNPRRFAPITAGEHIKRKLEQSHQP
ncbi:MAG: 2OG-Fe(II) oxygenase family protein [Pseudomonadota bacterium]